jgi:hypothetical protein
MLRWLPYKNGCYIKMAAISKWLPYQDGCPIKMAILQ